MRNKFISSLVKFAREDDRIILIVGDLGYGVIEPFVDEFPDRFLMLELQSKIWSAWRLD